MAYWHTRITIDERMGDLDRLVDTSLQSIGLQVEHRPHQSQWRLGTELPRAELRPEQHVLLVCDWSNSRNTGEMAIEAHSGESMAHEQTHAQQVFRQFCQTFEGLRASAAKDRR